MGYEQKTPSHIYAAQEHYTAALPYHNWEHAQMVMEDVRMLSTRLAKRNIPVDESPLLIAAAWHDAGFHEDHLSLGFETKEHYSAWLFKEYAHTARIGRECVSIVEKAILGTIHGASRDDVNTLVLHRSDVQNIGGPTDAFLRASVKLWREQTLVQGPVSWDDFKASSRGYIRAMVTEAREELPRIGESIGQMGDYDIQAVVNANNLSTITPEA